MDGAGKPRRKGEDAMCQVTEWTFPSADGRHTAYATTWAPEGGRVRAVIQITHGMMEHIGRYDRFARSLCGRGFLVCGGDHLGHGRTASEPGDLGYFAERDGVSCLVEDEERIRRKMQAQYPDKPYFLLGHSMGSFITRRYITLHGEGLAGYICCGTAGRNPLAGLGIFLAGLLCRIQGGRHIGRFLNKLAFQNYNKRIENPKTPLDWLSRDIEGYPDASGDPKCHFIFTNSGFRDLFRLLDSVSGRKWSGRVPKGLPIALFSGEMDPVGSYGRGVRQVYGWLKAAGVRDVTLKLYPGARHELHNELNRDEFTADLVGWMEARIDGGQAG
jgi:hypothetical protein